MIPTGEELFLYEDPNVCAWRIRTQGEDWIILDSVSSHPSRTMIQSPERFWERWMTDPAALKPMTNE